MSIGEAWGLLGASTALHVDIQPRPQYLTFIRAERYVGDLLMETCVILCALAVARQID